MSDRLGKLRALLEVDPDDAFTRYAIAMELKKHDRRDEALAEFEELVKRCPDYVATYYHYGALLANLGRRDDARAILDRGLAAAAKAGDEHSADELRESIEALDA